MLHFNIFVRNYLTVKGKKEGLKKKPSAYIMKDCKI